jgi:hypothetical protein
VNFAQQFSTAILSTAYLVKGSHICVSCRSNPIGTVQFQLATIDDVTNVLRCLRGIDNNVSPFFGIESRAILFFLLSPALTLLLLPLTRINQRRLLKVADSHFYFFLELCTLYASQP